MNSKFADADLLDKISLSVDSTLLGFQDAEHWYYKHVEQLVDYTLNALQNTELYTMNCG